MTITAILVLGIAGNVMEPQWEPQEYDPPAEFIGVAAADDPLQAPSRDVVRDEVAVEVAGETLEGLVYAPADSPAEPAEHPAVVFLHGAGTKDRTGFAKQADHLAGSGVVSLVLDRRTEGYSTWDRDYELMAEDALAGVELLRERSDVDPEQVGLFGESEGSWVAPIAAANDPDVAFMVLVSAPIVPPSQQATYATLVALDGLDAPAPVKHAVAKGIGLAMTVPNLLEYATFDVLPYLERTDQPILMAFGTEDDAVPIVQAADLVAAANDELTVRYFDGAQHAIRIGDEFGQFADGYLDLLSSWIHTAAAGPRLSSETADAPAAGDSAEGAVDGTDVAGGQPVQRFSASAVPPPSWYATAYAHAAALLLAVAGYFAGPVAARVVKSRRGDRAPRLSRSLRRRLRWLRLLGAGSLASLVVYFWGLSHLALNHATSTTITYGLWAVVWIITAGAVTALLNLWLDDSWRMSGLAAEVGDGYPAGKLNRLEVVAVAGAVTGTILLLMIVTYWGVFLGI